MLGPIALLMDGTLTLLIRHRVRADVERAARWKIAVLYAVNTAGAAAGAFLTDFALIPAAGLRATQLVAVGLNVVAGAGALLLSRSVARLPMKAPAPARRRQKIAIVPESPPTEFLDRHRHVVIGTCVALMLSGFAAMGMEMLWLCHFNLLLGGFRAVFSLVLTIMLTGIGSGAFIAGVITRWSAKPVQHLMMVQALLAAALLLGLASNSFSDLDRERHAIEAALAGLSPFGRRSRSSGTTCARCSSSWVSRRF